MAKRKLLINECYIIKNGILVQLKWNPVAVLFECALNSMYKTVPIDVVIASGFDRPLYTAIIGESGDGPGVHS